MHILAAVCIVCINQKLTNFNALTLDKLFFIVKILKLVSGLQEKITSKHSSFTTLTRQVKVLECASPVGSPYSYVGNSHLFLAAKF